MPPLTAVAVKVMEAPAHEGLFPDVIPIVSAALYPHTAKRFIPFVNAPPAYHQVLLLLNLGAV